MRLISFFMTTDQVRDEIKDVTRRVGWWHLKTGDFLCGVVKGQGLKEGEEVERINVIKVKDVRPERLGRMLDDREYGFEEIRREGFQFDEKYRWPSAWVPWFCEGHSTKAKPCTENTTINRIEFTYVLPRSADWSSDQMEIANHYQSETGDYQIRYPNRLKDPLGNFSFEGRQYLHQSAFWKIRLVNWCKRHEPTFLQKL